MSPSIIYQTIQWFKQAFDIEITEDVLITAPIYQLFAYITVFGVILLSFILLTYISKNIFKRKINYPEKEILRELEDISYKQLRNYYMIYVVLIGVIIFLFLLELSAGVIPLSTAGIILIFTIGNALGTIIVYYFLIVRKTDTLTFSDIGRKIKKMCNLNSKHSLIFGIFAALLFIIAFSSTWHWSVVNVLASLQEIGIMIIIIFIAFPFFLLKEFYFRTVQGRLKSLSRSREYFSMVLIGIFMDSFLFGIAKLFNWMDVIYMPDIFLYLLVWIIFSIIYQFTTTWVYMLSGRNILGSTVFISVFFAWMSIIFLPSLGFL